MSPPGCTDAVLHQPKLTGLDAGAGPSTIGKCVRLAAAVDIVFTRWPIAAKTTKRERDGWIMVKILDASSRLFDIVNQSVFQRTIVQILDWVPFVPFVPFDGVSESASIT